MRRNTRGAWSAVCGLLSTLTIPVAVGGTRYSDSYELLQSGFAIPFAFVLGILAIVLARRARAFERATLGRAGGARTAAIGRFLGILGLCIASSATIAVAVYGLGLALD